MGLPVRRRERTPEGAREIAPGVFCLRLPGLTRTNVYFVRSESSWALVDTGWPGDASRIERAATSLLGRDHRPGAILLTHEHPDHDGSALELARRWRCPVFMHPEELPIAARDLTAMAAVANPLDRWLLLPMMRALGTRRREAMLARSNLRDVARGLEPGAEVPGLPDWDCIHTPGHTPGHLSFFRPADRVVLTGDAVVTLRVDSLAGLLLQRAGLSGGPWYTTWDMQAARDSVERLARLEPRVLAGGHGEPMTGVETAARLHAFASEGRR